MMHKSELRLSGIDAGATREKLKGGFAPTTRAAGIEAIYAGEGRGQALGRTSIAALAVFVVGAGLTCVAQLVIARIIGPDSYGVYAYVLAWVALLGYFST